MPDFVKVGESGKNALPCISIIDIKGRCARKKPIQPLKIVGRRSFKWAIPTGGPMERNFTISASLGFLQHTRQAPLAHNVEEITGIFVPCFMPLQPRYNIEWEQVGTVTA